MKTGKLNSFKIFIFRNKLNLLIELILVYLNLKAYTILILPSLTFSLKVRKNVGTLFKNERSTINFKKFSFISKLRVEIMFAPKI